MFRTYTKPLDASLVISRWSGDCMVFTVCETQKEYNAEKERLTRIDKEYEEQKKSYMLHLQRIEKVESQLEINRQELITLREIKIGYESALNYFNYEYEHDTEWLMVDAKITALETVQIKLRKLLDEVLI